MERAPEARVVMPPFSSGKSVSSPNLNGSMKIRRTNSKSYSRNNLIAYGLGPHHDRRDSRDGPTAMSHSLSSRLKVLSFYLTVFISGCLLTGFLLSMSPQQPLERSSARLMLQHPAGTVHRRGLYTAGTGGECSLSKTKKYWGADAASGPALTPAKESRARRGSWLPDQALRHACWCMIPA